LKNNLRKSFDKKGLRKELNKFFIILKLNFKNKIIISINKNGRENGREKGGGNLLCL
jgi:hypothetical protein